MNESYDLIVIGGGPAGYHAAIRGAQLGLKSACVEMRNTLGGTCLNVGCIPSKALLESSEHYEKAHHDLASHGVVLESVKLDLAKMLKRKDDVVAQTTKGIAGLFKKNKIAHIVGKGSLEGNNRVKVLLADGGEKIIEGKHIVLATGSVPVDIPQFPADEVRILSSTGALSIPEVPKHLVVIGGGVIGLELGSVWRRLGSKVTVIEAMDRICPFLDGAISREFQKILKKQGVEFLLSSKVLSVTKTSEVELQVKVDMAGKESEIACDYVLVSVGRKPYSEGLGLEKAGVKINARGFVEVDEHFKTSVKGVYAVGDLVPGPMLAHKAMEDAVACVERICGVAGHVDYSLVPWVIYTHPEVAGVGMTEEEAKSRGYEVRVGQFPFMASGRARAAGDVDGFVKILADAKTDRILGAHMIGAKVSEIIAEMVMAIQYCASAEDVARTVHAHPTLSEAVKEAALGVSNQMIHL
ncbi:MAG: dihydrolipoyl dehydrogenase [Candidatus Cloacimonetes bacterium]|nr:dihydrolipoyl dehydrogenase [Candidatus Cloacimonadota bacterium]